MRFWAPYKTTINAANRELERLTGLSNKSWSHNNLLVGWWFCIHCGTEPWFALLDTGGGAEDLDLQVMTRGDAGLLREPKTCLLLYLLHHMSHHYPVIVGDGHLIRSIMLLSSIMILFIYLHWNSMEPFPRPSQTKVCPGECHSGQTWWGDQTPLTSLTCRACWPWLAPLQFWCREKTELKHKEQEHDGSPVPAPATPSGRAAENIKKTEGW